MRSAAELAAPQKCEANIPMRRADFRQFLLGGTDMRKEGSVSETFHKTLLDGGNEGRCNCRALLAGVLKHQAIQRKLAIAMIREGRHPFEHSAGR